MVLQQPWPWRGASAWGRIHSRRRSGLLEAFRTHPVPARHSPEGETASGSGWRAPGTPGLEQPLPSHTSLSEPLLPRPWATSEVPWLTSLPPSGLPLQPTSLPTPAGGLGIPMEGRPDLPSQLCAQPCRTYPRSRLPEPTQTNLTATLHWEPRSLSHEGPRATSLHWPSAPITPTSLSTHKTPPADPVNKWHFLQSRSNYLPRACTPRDPHLPTSIRPRGRASPSLWHLSHQCPPNGTALRGGQPPAA